MILYNYKPVTPGLRGKIKIVNNLYKGKILKKNIKKIIFNAGRNNKGRITVRHKGGKRKRNYRFIDFFRNKEYIVGRIERFEYDPFRSSNIALIVYFDGERRYIIAPKNVSIGDQIVAGDDVPINIGNYLPLRNIPIGTKIHCLENKAGKGMKIARSSGNYCTILSKSKKTVVVSTPSLSYITLDHNCRAVIGEVGNEEHFLINYGKAGAKRMRGIRPTVRGVAMNPVDHPHGGGEGKTSGGRDPVSPWGKISKVLKKKGNV